MTNGCQDDLSIYNSEESITLNLLLSYGKYGTGQGEFEDSDFVYMENEIRNVFEPYNIHFNIMWHNLDCDDCLVSYYDNPAWPEFFNGTTCIQGHIVTTFANTGNIGGEAFGIGDGKFWSKPSSLPHELGHAIGLLHTHQPESGLDFITSELVTRSIPSDENDPCSCNCLSTGDRICDTPPDPNIGFASTQEELDWVDAMFNGCTMTNSDNETDACSSLFADPNQMVMNNVMSYHCDDPTGVARLTEGQSHRIRMMLDNGNGTYKFQYDPTQMPFSSGIVVNNSTIINSNEAFNGDIVVNSDLTIENCVVELTEGRKIIVNPEASLTIKNATIRTYTGAICYFQLEGKRNWEGIEIIPGNGAFTNVSILNSSFIDKSESAIYNPVGTSGLLNLYVNNSEVKGPDLALVPPPENKTTINLSNNIGICQLYKSTFDQTVKTTNSFYLKVEGSTFDFINGSQESGIKAMDTHLYVAQAYGGQKSTFTNCGKGIEFISSSAQSCRIGNSTFDKVQTGIDAKSVAGFLTVHDCDISIVNPGNISGFEKGIKIDNFIDYDIYNNTIEGFANSGIDGIQILHSGLNDNPNLIINNSISTSAVGINSSSAELGNMMSGIEFNCNVLSHIQGNNFTTGKIGPQQGRGGENGIPAGNKFDGTPESACASIPIGNWEMWCNSDFNYSGGGWQYEQIYHYRDDELPAGVSTENLEWDNTDQEPGFGKNLLNALLQPSCTYPVISNDPNPLPTVKTIRKNLLDGGDTDGSINLVLDDSSSDPERVLTEILGDSPWVSIPVAQAILANSQYYTESQVAQVIIQNPGVLDDPYINAIVFETNSFSSANQQLMIQAAEAGDIRINHEQSLVDAIKTGTLHIKDEINNQLASGIFDENIIRTLVDTKISNTRLFQTIESFVNEDNFSSAIARLNSRMSDQTFDPLLINEANVYGEILAIGNHLYSNSKTWSKLSGADISRLNTIANTYNGKATIKARNILEIYHGTIFGSMPARPAYSPITFGNISPRNAVHDHDFTVFPNPSNGTININLKNDVNLYSMDIISPQGTIVKSLKIQGTARMDVSDLPNGVYMYTIYHNEGVIVIDKFIILK